MLTNGVLISLHDIQFYKKKQKKTRPYFHVYYTFCAYNSSVCILLFIMYLFSCTPTYSMYIILFSTLSITLTSHKPSYVRSIFDRHQDFIICTIPPKHWITTGYGTLAESLKCEYFKTTCLGGLREVTLIHQFQSRKTVTFRTTLFMLIPVLLCGIWLPLQYSNMHNANLLSTSILLQRHNIHAKFIRFPCAYINSFTYAKNQKLLYTLLRIFTAVTGWLYFLILLAGDIELNPGPYSPDISLSSDSSGSPMDVSVFESNFSVVHYNVQSLLNKIDLLQVELSHFDVIALSETWLSLSIDDTDLKLLNYQSPFRKDRQTNNYGGVIVYVRDNIPCKRRPDLEVQGLESLWLELRLKSKVVLFGTFYRPPNSSNEILDKIEESIDLALDNDVADVIVTGDFNLNFLDNANRAKIMSVFDQYSLYQLINEPTHYTETSSTLIDLLFTRNPENIIISGVGEAFLEQNLRYHCPTYAVFMPRHQKVAGYYVIPSKILSVRPSVRLSVCPSVRPSVRPSAPTTILVSATPPTVLGQSFWNFTGVLRMVWRYAYCFFRILKLFFITFFPFLT